MSEERNETGQFQSPAFGQESVERAQGYTPMPDTEADEPAQEFDSAQDAAQALTEQLPESTEATVRTYTGEGIGEFGFGLGDGQDAETITPERAARDLTEMRAKEAQEADDKAKEDLAKEVDELRGEDAKPDDAATKADEPIADDLIDAEIERALKHPKIKEAVEQRLTAADTARQQFSETTQSTVQLAEIMFLTQFPEISALDPAQREQAAEAMRINDPARYQKLVAVLNHAQAAHQQLQSAKQFEQVENVQKFNSYATAEDARFDAMISDAPEIKAKVGQAVQDIATEAGLSAEQFMHLFRTEPIMRNAAFQKMMYDAGQYRIMQARMEEARSAPIRKHLPPVQRPGVSRGSGASDSHNIATLERRLNATGSVKDAAALVTAKRRMAAR